MTLNIAHKDFIKTIISPLFNLPHDIEALRTQTSQIVEALNGRVDDTNPFNKLSMVFRSKILPQAIIDLNTPECVIDIHDARKYILEYANEKIVEAADSSGVTPADLGWNHVKLTFLRPIKNTNQKSWDDWDYNPPQITIATSLATENGQAMLASGLLTPEIAEELGPDRLVILVTNEGRQLLEGTPAKLTIPQAIESFSYQILEMAFDEHSRRAIGVLRAHDPHLSLEASAAQLRSLNASQIYDVSLGVSIGEVTSPSSDRITVERQNDINWALEPTGPLNATNDDHHHRGEAGAGYGGTGITDAAWTRRIAPVAGPAEGFWASACCGAGMSNSHLDMAKTRGAYLGK